MGSSLLLISFTVSLSSLRSLIQTAYSLDSVPITGSTSRVLAAQYTLGSDVIIHSESSSERFEDRGQGSGSTLLQKLINRAVASKEPDGAGSENLSGSGIRLLSTTPTLTLHHSGAHDRADDEADPSITGYTHSGVHMISEEALLENSHIQNEKYIFQSSVVDDFQDGWDGPELPIQNNVFTSTEDQNLSGLSVLSSSPCVVLTNITGTNLLWDDMRRTLPFAWELHVFGSASLFILMVALAVMGMASPCILPHPLCDALTLANSLLILSGTLRGVLLLLDPYGTRQILSHATLAALHNVPLHLLLWAQVTFALVPFRGIKLLLFPQKLQHPWVVGGLATSHCTMLLVADLLSSTLSPYIPFLLQNLSLCWGLPFCMEILTKFSPHLRPVLRSSVPQSVPSLRIEKNTKRVKVVCAFLGVLCCSLQVYSLLWLYGLLGDWRRFGWGWWLSQFWARILELAWGFSLLVLGSWIFWVPSRGLSRGNKGKSELSKGAVETSLWGSVFARIRKGPQRNSEKNWEDLMPSNCTGYNLSKTGFSKNLMCPYDDQPFTIVPEYKPEPVNNSDSQAALLWQKVGEHECVLSLVEFDVHPLSPINLRWGIDNAFHHRQLVAGGLFTPPPPSWTQTLTIDTTGGGGGATTFPGYRWMDTESISPSLDHFQAQESIQSPCAYNSSVCSPAAVHTGEELNSVLAVTHLHEWAVEDVTDL